MGLLCIGLALSMAILEVGVRFLGLAPQIAPTVIDQPYATFESLPREKTFAKQLEKRLNEQPIPGYERAEVINLSVWGYDTSQEAEFLQVKGLALEPDLVMIAQRPTPNAPSTHSPPQWPSIPDVHMKNGRCG